MNLLVITQKVSRSDSNLGFFHEWLKRLAKRVEHLDVICLEKGSYSLPDNVSVYSLGKETINNIKYSIFNIKYFKQLKYIYRFYKYLWKLRGNYDGIFVHMNPEYLILCGILWRMWRKKILLWYTHKTVNLKLRIAAGLATKIFTASKESFRLCSKKVEVTGHGIPVEMFSSSHEVPMGNDLWLLWIGRITPVKDLETVVKAVGELKENKALPAVRFTVIGNSVTKEDNLYKSVIEESANKLIYEDGGLAVGFRSERRNYSEMPDVYHRYHLLIHTSRTGSIDKVVLEALAAGRIVVTSSEAFADLAEGELKDVMFRFPSGDSQALAQLIEKIWHDGIIKAMPNQQAMAYVGEHHNLDVLIGKIIGYFE